MSSPWLVARGLTKAFRSEHRKVEVLRGVDLDVAPGEFVAITGPSGSGKSTLLNLLGSLDRPDAGRILWGDLASDALDDAKRSRLRNRQVGFVFQQHHLLGDFTALENVLMPARIGGRLEEHRDRAEALLRRVGLESRMTHLPGELSGGEQQRVAVARAMINAPRMLFLDEPGGNLDRKRADELHALLLDLAQDDDVGVVAVTHDESLARLAHRWMRLFEGLLVPHEGANIVG